MESLLRTKVSDFTLEGTWKLSEIQERKEAGKIEEILLPVDEVFSSLKKLKVGKEQETLVHNGNPFSLKNREIDIKDGEWMRVYDDGDKFVAIYAYEKEKNRLRIVKMFFN